MPTPAYMWLKDDSGKAINGSVKVAGREKSVEVVEFEHEVRIPTDADTGKLTGTRKHESIRLLKAMDASSPYLYKAVCKGQTFKEVLIKEYNMIKKTLFFVVIFSAICCVDAGMAGSGECEFELEFVGYDSLTPIFVSTENYHIMSEYKQNYIYKYVNGHLIRMNISIPKNAKLLVVKNDIYIFCLFDSLNSLARLQFKLNGKEIVAQHSISTKWDLWPSNIAVNNKNLFICNEVNDNKGLTILRVEYRTQSMIDTINIKQSSFGGLYGADNDYLYYSTMAEDSDAMCLYQFNFETGVTKMIEVCQNVEGVVIAPHRNMVYLPHYKWSEIVNYKTNYRASSHNEVNNWWIFFSYEHNAFVNYYHSSNIDRWRTFHLLDNVGRGKTFRLQVTHTLKNPRTDDKCATNIARVYKKITNCDHLSNMSGSQIYDYLAKSSLSSSPKFKEVKIEEVQEFANKGHIVIAARKDLPHTDVHGHVVMAVSGKAEYGRWGIDINGNPEYKNLPIVMDQAAEDPSGKQVISKSYSSDRNSVHFFLYIGKYCGIE